MNDQQLETVLRRSLARHADTIDSGPTWPLDDDILAEHRARRRPPATWLAVAAAVVAVLAVIGAAVAIRHAMTDHSRPATPDTVTRTACPTALPKAWADASNAGRLPASVGNEVLGIGPDDEVLVPQVGPTDTDQAELVLVRRDGSIQPIEKAALIDIYRSLAFDIFSFQTVAIDQRWIVLPMMSVGFKNITVRLELIDRTNVHNKREIHTSTDPDKIALFDNHLYWIDGNKGHATSSVEDYDIATGKTRELTKQAKYLAATPHGVAWTDAQDGSHVIAGQDATLVPGQPGSEPELVSDGPNYAWWTDAGVGWYSDATKQTVFVRDNTAAKAGHAVAAVVGPYVMEFVNGDGGMRVIDTRTGAAGRIGEVGRVISAGGDIAYLANRPTRVDIKGLPGLHC